MADIDLMAELNAARCAVARAVKAGDVEAEQAARGRMAMVVLRRTFAHVADSGARFTAEQIAELHALVGVVEGSAAGACNIGSNPLEQLRRAAEVAGAEGDCDRCGAAEATLSGSLDLTGTENPPISLVRLCGPCRGGS